MIDFKDTKIRQAFFLGALAGLVIGFALGAWVMHDWLFATMYKGCVMCLKGVV